MPYLTPDSPPVGEFFCRVLRVPATPSFLSLVDGAITELCKAYNFEQFGTLTPDETAEIFIQMWLDAMNAGNVCMAEAQIDIGVHEVNQNTNGGGIVLNTNTSIPFNSIGSLSHGNFTLGANVFTVKPGFYHVRMEHVIRLSSGATVMCWADTSDNPGAFHEGTRAVPAGGSPVMLTCEFLWRIDAEETCEFFARSSASQTNTAFGNPANVAGHNELYGNATFTRLGDA